MLYHETTLNNYSACGLQCSEVEKTNAKLTHVISLFIIVYLLFTNLIILHALRNLKGEQLDSQIGRAHV